MWFLLNFGPSGYSADMSQTYGSLLGKWIVPFFAPIGLGYWQIVVALIAGISARSGGPSQKGALSASPTSLPTQACLRLWEP